MTMHPVARLPEEWKEILAARAERPFRAQQIFKWIHARGVLDPELMTDLGEPLRQWLTEEGLGDAAEIASVHRSTDATRKVLVKLADGVTIETVIIPANKNNEADADVASRRSSKRGGGIGHGHGTARVRAADGST